MSIMVNFASVNLIEEEGMSSTSNDSMDEAGQLEVSRCVQEMLMVEEEVKKRTLEGSSESFQRGPKIKVPRLLVHDIRKSYPAMIANVLNSCNFSMLYGFLDTFFDLNVQFTRVRKFTDEQRSCTLHLNNVYELAKFWYSLMRMSPDSVMKMSDSRIQYTTGNIISNMVMNSTFLYETPMDAGYYASYILLDERYGREVLYANDKIINDFVVGRKYTSISCGNVVCDEKLQDMKDIQSSVDRIVDSLPLRENPEKVETKGTFILSTDENKRIIKVDVVLVMNE